MLNFARARSSASGVDPATVPADEWQAVYAEIKAQTDKNASWSCRQGDLGGLQCTLSARSATKAGASTISFAAAPAGKVIRSSRFYLSLEDDLLRIFGSDRLSSIMGKLGMVEGEPIEHRMITKAIEGAQRKVEGHNFEIRKHLLEYDDVMNKQREVIYELRTQVLGADQLKDTFLEMLEEVVDDLVAEQLSADLHPEEWDLVALQEAIKRQFGVEVNVQNSPHQGRFDLLARVHLRALAPELRSERSADGRAHDASPRKGDHVAAHRHPLEGSPPGHGSPEGGYWPARLCPEEPPERIQAGSLRDVPRR